MEEILDVINHDIFAEGLDFIREIASFQVENTVRQGIKSVGIDAFFDERNKIGEVGHGSTNNEIEFAVHVLHPFLRGLYIA